MPWIAHLNKQANGQTHHCKKPSTWSLKLLKYERYKGQRMILTSVAKTNVYVLIYLTVFINFYIKIFNKNTSHILDCIFLTIHHFSQSEAILRADYVVKSPS